ncbi:MAG: acyl esterase [Deltaproteobacteria bacterium]
MSAGEPRVITAVAHSGSTLPRYSICTLVTRLDQYAEMRETFAARGFDSATSEYLYLNNGGPDQCGAYRGLNALLNAARGHYVILCHQDVRLLEDGIDALDRRLSELDGRDPNWALAGNAGGVAPGRLAFRISDPHGAGRHSGSLPVQVMSLDENFIVVKRSARIGCSVDLEGFHFYGADLCLNADVAGHSAWVIDFHLHHLSGGNKIVDFFAMEEAFRAKWSHALRPRWMQTTCALLRLSGFGLDREAGRIAARPFAGLLRRLPARIAATKA